MLNRKKLWTIVLLLTIMVIPGLLVSPFISQVNESQPTVEWYGGKMNEPQILHDDNFLPDQVAHAVINAQEVAEIGELVRFDLSESVAQSFRWLLIPDTLDFETYNDGQCAVFSARKPGIYMFIVGCAYNNTVDIAIHTVLVEGVIDPVNPDDPNDEYPDIAKPEIDADLSQWVAYWCSINKRPKAGAMKLAGSFESVAAQIAAGTLQKADDIVKATANANRVALGDSLPSWVPVLQELQTTLKNLAIYGKLSTPDQHQVLWLKIAKGLRNYVSLFN